MSAYSHLLDEERDSIFGRIAPALRKSITFDNDIMARAGGHTSGRCREGSEELSHIGDDRPPRTRHCPCGARATGKRRNADADESRHSSRLGQTETPLSRTSSASNSPRSRISELYQTLDVHNSAELGTKIWLAAGAIAAWRSSTGWPCGVLR
jgi:hypothetical protein